MNDYEFDDYFIGIELGTALLKSGAETSRVEDSVERIIYSLGAKHVHAYATFTSLMVSIEIEGNKPFTQIRTIYSRSVNLGRIAKLNQLSRFLVSKKISVNEAREQIEYIQSYKEYSDRLKIFSAGLNAFGFGFIFTNSVNISIASFFVAVLNQIAITKVNKYNFSNLISNMIYGASLEFFCIAISMFLPNISYNEIILGAVMPLVPGVIITNAIRDLESGHYITAFGEILEGTIIAFGISSGVLVTLHLSSMLLGGF